MYSTKPHSSTGRRPTRSATGPQNSWATPKASIKADIVNCASAIGAARLRVSAGRVGKYRSVVTGCKPNNNANAQAAWVGEMTARPQPALTPAECAAPNVAGGTALAWTGGTQTGSLMH